MCDDLYHTKVSAPVTHHWKELRNSNLRHSAPLQMLFQMAFFSDNVKIFRFWPKTMDYNPWFDFGSPKKVVRKARHSKENEKRNLLTLFSVA